jgi:palmitoyl-protein thioesterase
VNKSVFLSDINNERGINETYKTNLQLLENFILVMFEDETVVQPRESEWFGFFEVGSDTKMIPLEDSTLYTEVVI